VKDGKCSVGIGCRRRSRQSNKDWMFQRQRNGEERCRLQGRILGAMMWSKGSRRVAERQSGGRLISREVQKRAGEANRRVQRCGKGCGSTDNGRNK